MISWKKILTWFPNQRCYQASIYCSKLNWHLQISQFGYEQSHFNFIRLFSIYAHKNSGVKVHNFICFVRYIDHSYYTNVILNHHVHWSFDLTFWSPLGYLSRTTWHPLWEKKYCCKKLLEPANPLSVQCIRIPLCVWHFAISVSTELPSKNTLQVN